MILYRYFKFDDALATLESRQLRDGRFSTFNDPFEFLPQDSYSLGGSKALVSDFHRKMLLEVLDEKFGVLCFSHESTIERPILWSHYADCHRGIALGFKVHEESKNGPFYLRSADGIKSSAIIGPVVYGGFGGLDRGFLLKDGIALRIGKKAHSPTNLRVKIPEFDELVNNYDDFEENEFEDKLRMILDRYTPALIYHKGEDWTYEKEWRASVHLHRCHYHGGHHSVSLEDLTLAEIVFGMRHSTPPSFLESLASSFGAKILVASPTPDQYALKLSPL